MGGSGSGSSYQWWRSAKKTTIEDGRLLDANRWMREGILQAGVWHTGGWYWFRDAERKERSSDISYEVDTTGVTPWVRLIYTFKATGINVDYKVPLTTTRPRFGGLRWWFLCPLTAKGQVCYRRVGKLYLPPTGSYFGCRHCHDLTYTSCQESHKYDGFYRLMARNTGFDPATIKEVMDSLGKGR